MRDTQSLLDLFHNRIFKVPDYQRGYAWEEQQVGEFLDDLELLDSDRFHYTGTVVLFERPDARHLMDNEGNSYVETEIVDGQQRLTTIVLLLNEMSKALNSYDEGTDLANGIRKRFVETIDPDRQPLHKLSLSDDTDHFFKNSVLSNGSVEGRPVMAAQRLEDARRQIADYLHRANGDDEAKEAWLRDLHAKVTNKLQFNLYEVDWEGEVGVIFEVMNDRGKQLTELEKVQNYLLHAASSLHVTPDNKDSLARLVNNTWGSDTQTAHGRGTGDPGERGPAAPRSLADDLQPPTQELGWEQEHQETLRPSERGGALAATWRASKICAGAPRVMCVLLRCPQTRQGRRIRVISTRSDDQRGHPLERESSEDRPCRGLSATPHGRENALALRATEVP